MQNIFNQLVTTLYPYQKSLTIKGQRLFLWLLIASFLVSISQLSQAKSRYYSITPENIDTRFMGIDIHDSFLITQDKKDPLPVIELSDIAWDHDQQLLYAISDSGYLYHFKLNIDNNKLKAIDLVFSTTLKDKAGKRLVGRSYDAEGLTLRHANNNKLNDSELIISFENNPRIDFYKTNGDFSRNIYLNKTLSNIQSYRHGNKALESVVLHEQYGILTSPELPLKKDSPQEQTLFSNKGKEWKFKATGIKNSSITSLEVLPNNNILILERAYNGILSPIIITLRELNITQCENKAYCDTQILAQFDSSEGWSLDNFEGLARVSDNLYLMISDNNKNPFQKTILFAFEIVNE